MKIYVGNLSFDTTKEDLQKLFEGHGKVTIRMDDEHKVVQTRLHIVEFRGFERFVQGRPFWEAIVLVQRLCGICPVSHHLCAAKAMDVVSGVPSSALTPTADKMRRLMHYGQIFQSHVLHFFHLASPDLVFGMDADPERRNIVGVIGAFPEIARKAVLMRRFGQEVIQSKSLALTFIIEPNCSGSAALTDHFRESRPLRINSATAFVLAAEALLVRDTYGISSSRFRY